jgi:mannose-6-phosphate isomerase-like protein (cupin superfamily)
LLYPQIDGEIVEPIVRRLSQGDWSGWPDDQVAARGKVTWKALQGVNDDEDTDMVLGVARVFKGESLEAHRHLQPETYYVLSGKGKVTIEHVEYEVETDTMVYIPGDALHQINNYDDEPLRILYLFATPHFADVIYKF